MNNYRNKQKIDSSIADRILLLILSTIITPILGVIVYFFHSWPTKGPNETIVKYFLFDIFLSFFIFGLLCFIWAVLGPQKMNRIISISYSKAVLALVLLGVGTLLTLIYAAFHVYF